MTKISASNSNLTQRLLDFKQERRKTENFLKRNRVFYQENHKVIPDKALDLLHQEQNSEKILHPITTENLDKIGVIRIKNLDLLIKRFKKFHQKIKGLPQFTVDFLSEKPSQVREIFLKEPSQTSLVECDKHHFLIQLNPTYNDFSLRNSKEKLKLYGQYTIPPRLVVWFIHSDYMQNKSEYPILEALDDNDKKDALLKNFQDIYNQDTLALRYGKKDSPERQHADSQEDNPNAPTHLRRFSFSKIAERKPEQETNQQREERTGKPYLASILFLEPQKHLEMLKQLKKKCLEYMDKTYGIPNSQLLSKILKL